MTPKKKNTIRSVIKTRTEKKIIKIEKKIIKIEKRKETEERSVIKTRMEKTKIEIAVQDVVTATEAEVKTVKIEIAAEVGVGTAAVLAVLEKLVEGLVALIEMDANDLAAQEAEKIARETVAVGLQRQSRNN